MIQTAIRNRLIARDEIKALVTNRIYYVHLPQNPTYPCISFFRVSNPRRHNLNVSNPRFQFDVWSTKYSEAVDLANQIRLALQREKGVWNGIPIIQGVYLNEQEFYENDTKLFHIASDYRIIYKEA